MENITEPAEAQLQYEGIGNVTTQDHASHAHQDASSAVESSENCAHAEETQKPARVRKACGPCIALKARCDRMRPCARCARKGVACVDVSRKRRTTKPKP